MIDRENTTEETTPFATPPELVVITGMSGAGRSEAIHTFEDLGYFCIDNLPPSFIGQLVDLAELPGSRIRSIAVVCDVRSLELFDQMAGVLKRLEDSGVPFRLLFLEADDKTLLRRFKETRRRHPMLDESGSILDGIQAERIALSDVRRRADFVIDTTESRPQDLRRAIRERFFGKGVEAALAITVISFGFKYGIPADADVVMDVRFLPNPYYIAELRDLTGLQMAVRRYVLDRDETYAFLDRWFTLLESIVPGYLLEGKSHLAIALGCTGGMHRSVVLAEQTASFLRGMGYLVAVSHRDINKDRER